MSQPMVAAPMAQPFVPAGSMTALTNQSVSMPTSRSSTRVRVRGPGLFGSSLARLGERMTQLGKTRIETTQETEMAASFTQPSGGVATFQTSALDTAPGPTNDEFHAPAPAAAPNRAAPTPQIPMASPQAAPSKHSHFWNHQ